MSLNPFQPGETIVTWKQLLFLLLTLVPLLTGFLIGYTNGSVESHANHLHQGSANKEDIERLERHLIRIWNVLDRMRDQMHQRLDK